MIKKFQQGKQLELPESLKKAKNTFATQQQIDEANKTYQARINAGQVQRQDGSWMTKEQHQQAIKDSKTPKKGNIDVDYSDPLTMGITAIAAPGQGLLKAATTKLSPKLNTVGKVIREGVDMIDPTSIGVKIKNVNNTSDNTNIKSLFSFMFNPVTKNKEAKITLKNFKERINTDEGKRRIKELDLKDYDIDRLNNLGVYDNPETIAHYNPMSQVNINPFLDRYSTNKIVRHEIEHAIQGYSKNKIDTDLENLELKYKSETNPYLNKKDKTVSKEEYELDSRNPKKYLSDKQNATDYFKWGSEGREKSAFLAEVQEWAVDKGLIKHHYDKVTPEKMKEIFNEYQFDKEYPLRIFDIMKPSEHNYKLLSDNFNRLLTPSAIGTGLGIKASTNDNKSLKIGGKFKKGGLFKFIK